MLKKLTFKQKNYILLAGTALLLVVSWKFAFKNTYDAVVLHLQLQRKTEERNNLAFNPAYLDKKNSVLRQLTARYTQKPEEWKNSFWLTVSGVAVRNNVNINYNPSSVNIIADSSAVIQRQTIIFEGSYRNLVGLLDTLHKTPRAGFITSLSFRREKEFRTETIEKLRMEVIFSAIKGKE